MGTVLSSVPREHGEYDVFDLHELQILSCTCDTCVYWCMAASTKKEKVNQ